MISAAQRLALPASGRDERTPFCRNQFQATQTARKRADSHQSGGRCVGGEHGLYDQLYTNYIVSRFILSSTCNALGCFIFFPSSWRRNGPLVNVLYRETQNYFVIGLAATLCPYPDIAAHDNRNI